jgi:hypothetical protein
MFLLEIVSKNFDVNFLMKKFPAEKQLVSLAGSHKYVKVRISIPTLSAVRYSDSSATFAYASQQVVHRQHHKHTVHTRINTIAKQEMN